MKRFVIAALAAASVLTGGAAMAAPLHVLTPHHGPGGFHPGHGPGGFHPGPGGFHPGPIGFHPGPGGFHPGPGGFHPVGGFHHWGYGAYLPREWLIPARFVVDFVDFEWVQDGPNALLVNLDTGMVVQVVPNAFA